MSRRASKTSRIIAARASITCVLRSPPSGPGRGSPFCRASARQRLTLAALAPEAFGSLPVGQAPFIHRGDNPPPQIQRKRHRHACRPPAPADIVNQKSVARGIWRVL
jgi:hypothetical protein